MRLLKAWEWYGVPSRVHRKKGREHSEEPPTSITCMTDSTLDWGKRSLVRKTMLQVGPLNGLWSQAEDMECVRT